MIDPYREEVEADFYRRLDVLALLLKAALEEVVKARQMANREEAHNTLDRVMEVLRDLVQQSCPPGPPPPIGM